LRRKITLLGRASRNSNIKTRAGEREELRAYDWGGKGGSMAKGSGTELAKRENGGVQRYVSRKGKEKGNQLKRCNIAQ